MTESVILVAYDPEWPRRFEAGRTALAAVFTQSDSPIEHIGGTAVPSLRGKPVINIMVGVSRLTEAEDRITALEAEGYECVQNETQLPERRYSPKPRRGPRTYHLHCGVKDGALESPHRVSRLSACASGGGRSVLRTETSDA
jgi:GrpB-like predicted nucleotidyltransferase (UPF0157 family)